MTLKNLTMATLLFTGLAAAMALAQTTPKAQQKMQEDKTVHSLPMKSGVYYQVVNFNPGSADISETAKASLKGIIEKAREHGDIDDVHIAVFADKPFPEKKKALNETEQGIANRRADTLKSYMKKTLNVDDVSTYDMSEKSNWLAKAFNTKDAELKALFESDNDTPLTHEEFLAVKANGAPSKAVVIVTLDDEARAAQEHAEGQ